MDDVRRTIPQAAEAIELLEDPTRRSVYRAVRDAGGPVTRAEVAHRTGVSVRLATFHLEKLVAGGLLAVHTSPKPRARSSSGGRPAKRYVPSAIQLELTVPPRRYDIAGGILVRALEACGLGSAAGKRMLEEARRTGAEAGTGTRLMPVLRDLGYEPQRRDGSVVLRNCPFRALTDSSRTATCHLNLALLQGVLEGTGSSDREARLTALPGECCVRIV